MKVRSLFLGSVALAGLSAGGAYAADLGVLTSLDVCDDLGLSGLTISSDTNCLQVSGEVKYKFVWGDYADDTYGETPDGTFDLSSQSNDYPNWESRFDAWLKFTATARSDFGPAKAVLKLKQVSVATGEQGSYFNTTAASTAVATVTGLSVSGGSTLVTGSTSIASTLSASNSGVSTYYSIGGSDTAGLILDEAYVSIGDSTVITAGKKGSLFNDGDDAPLNWLGLFNSSSVDPGVGSLVDIDDGGAVIQVTSDLGNGFNIGVGLEDLGVTGLDEDANNNLDNGDGTLVGVLGYSGDGISAHVSFAADDVLVGEIEDWKVHAGFTGTFDNFKVVAAAAFDSSEYYNVLASASVALDIFTLAASVEAAGGDASPVGDYYGVGGSLTAAVTDGVTINLGGRWASSDGDGDFYQVAAGVTAALSETLKLTGEVGYVNGEDSDAATVDDTFYGKAGLDWTPGGSTFTSSVNGTVYSEGGYKIESTFKKSFQ